MTKEFHLLLEFLGAIFLGMLSVILGIILVSLLLEVWKELHKRLVDGFNIGPLEYIQYYFWDDSLSSRKKFLIFPTKLCRNSNKRLLGTCYRYCSTSSTSISNADGTVSFDVIHDVYYLSTHENLKEVLKR